jgi:GNAT superfamily N-acetyltransferase
MITYKRTQSTDPHFLDLIKQLDAYLTITNGNEQAKFAQYNTVEKVKWVIIAYHNKLPIGCGGFKLNEGKAEIKRMYVNRNYRGLKIGEQILVNLEQWAQEENLSIAILETGINQKEAQNLYKKLGYQIIPNYGVYVNFTDSLCMEKVF